MNNIQYLKNENQAEPKTELYTDFTSGDNSQYTSTNSIECYKALIALIKDELGAEYDPLRDNYKFIPGLGEAANHTDY